LKQEACDVGEERSVGPRDSFLSYQPEKSGHGEIEAFAGVEARPAEEQFVGDGPDFSVGERLSHSFVNGAKTGSGAIERIGATPSNRGSETASVWFRNGIVSDGVWGRI